MSRRTSFTGFPEAALDFYDDLEMDNTKSYWEAHKPTYLESVKAPMTALTEALAPEFGTAKVFRPFRDVRFAKEKSTVNASSLDPSEPGTPTRKREQQTKSKVDASVVAARSLRD